jgi:hypothetical protein
MQVHSKSEPQIAIDCYKLFTILNETWDFNILNKLSLFLFKSLILEEKEMTALLFDTFGKLPEVKDVKSRELITTLGNTLLQSSSVIQMRTGLSMLDKPMFNSDVVKLLFKGRI